MSNLILLFLCLFLGVFLKWIKLLPENSHLVLNSFVLNISLSALSLFYIPKIEISSELLYPVAVAWLNIALSGLLFSWLGNRLGWSRQVTGAVILCAGFGNTSFVGIPLIQAFYGDRGLKTVMLVDQPGSFVAISTVGIAIAAHYAGGKSSKQEILKKILIFPPFLAFCLSVFLNIFNIEIFAALDEVFSKLGATTVPLALVSVGSQLKLERPGIYSKPLAAGLIFKLLIFPLAVFILYFLVLKQSGEAIEISILEAAMAPMITAAIIASTQGLAPKLCNLFIGIGIPLSLLTVFLWHLFISSF